MKLINEISLIRYIQKYRKYLLFFSLVIFLFLVVSNNVYIRNDDETMWIQNRSVVNTLKHPHNQHSYIYQLNLKVSEINESSLEECLLIHQQIMKQKNVVKIDDIFTVSYPKLLQGTSPNSQLLVFSKLRDVITTDRLSDFRAHQHIFLPYLNSGEMKFFIVTNEPVDLNLLKSKYDFDIIEPLAKTTPAINAIILIGMMLFGTLFLGFFFKTWVAPLVILVHTTISTVIALIVFQLNRAAYEHLIVIMIGIFFIFSNILYFYFKWHINQRYINAQKSLRYTLSRTLVPTLIQMVILSLSTFLIFKFSDSLIFYSISQFSLISSIVSLLTLLLFSIPLMSFFSLQKPTIIGFKYLKNMIIKLQRWNYSIFQLLLIGIILFTTMVGFYIINQNRETKNVQVITFAVKTKDFNADTLIALQRVEQEIQKVEYVERIESILDYVPYLYPKSSSSYQTSITGILFYLDLFDMRETFFHQSYPLLRIYLQSNDSAQSVIKEIKQSTYSNQLMFIDTNSLILNSKIDILKTMLIGSMTLLLLTGVFAGMWSKTKLQHSLAIILMNGLPILFIILMVWLTHYPISLALLSAIFVSTVFAADVEIHHFFNQHADGSTNSDDVIPTSKEALYTDIMIVFIHFISICLLSGSAFIVGGVIGEFSMFLAVLLFVSLLGDLMFIRKILKIDPNLLIFDY